MDIIIFGAGEAGKYLYSQIKQNTNNINVKAFVDNRLSGEIIDGIEVYKPERLFGSKILYDAIFIAAGAQKTLQYMIHTCRDNVVDNIYTSGCCRKRKVAII